MPVLFFVALFFCFFSEGLSRHLAIELDPSSRSLVFGDGKRSDVNDLVEALLLKPYVGTSRTLYVHVGGAGRMVRKLRTDPDDEEARRLARSLDVPMREV